MMRSVFVMYSDSLYQYLVSILNRSMVSFFVMLQLIPQLSSASYYKKISLKHSMVVRIFEIYQVTFRVGTVNACT
jgi:hypothetical protein